MHTISIEGRVSHSKVLLVTGDGNGICSIRGMGLEWREMPTGTRSWAILSLLRALAEERNSVLETLVNQSSRVVIAISGIDPRFGTEEINKAMQLYGFKREQIRLSSLAEIGYLGAFLGRPGILIRCGHGISVFVKTDKGEKRLIAGWGRLVSDEGSGHWLGTQALATTARVIDGRATLDERNFVNKLLQKMKISARINLFLKLEEDRALGGAFAVCQYLTGIGHNVVKIAEEGDDYAYLLITRSHRYIIDSISAALSDYTVTKHKIQLCVRGGLLEGEPFFCNLLVKTIIRELTYVFIDEDGKNGMFSPIVGAGLLSMNLSTPSDIEKKAGVYLDNIRKFGWSKPSLTNIPDC